VITQQLQVTRSVDKFVCIRDNIR